jgi:hypothetical protein
MIVLVAGRFRADVLSVFETQLTRMKGKIANEKEMA